MTFGLSPRAAHISQNWCNLAPTGRLGTKLHSDLHRKHILMTFVEHYRDLSLSFAAAFLQEEHDLQQVSLHLKSNVHRCLFFAGHI